MAKPMLLAAASLSLRATAVSMPTTWPAASTSGPPELPDEIAASVWISPSRTSPVRVAGLQRAPDGGHDAGGDRRVAVEVEREADRHHLIADADGRGVGERDGSEVLTYVDLQQREVVAAVGGDECRRGRLGVAGEADMDVGGALDDVGVGEDLAVLRHDDARCRWPGR